MSWADCEEESRKLIFQKSEEYLQSTDTNPFQGTVAVEKLQSYLKEDYKEDYESAVANLKFIEFLKLKKEKFIMLMIADPGQSEKSWRVALRSNVHWRQGDAMRQNHKMEFENNVVKDCIHYLYGKPNHSTDINNLTSIVEGLFNMRRGDLLRLLGRHHECFSISSNVDGSSKIISLTFTNNIRSNNYRQMRGSFRH
eukprot:NODE_6549_length_872_cov_35.407210_g5954_i0.p1 GENE.NODE_6549_length_872_cov_35.407210_g5954_i0~~NODE_6549_length_872_cov_35.407210_g5954_i0.p1  ORF type:complete len:215 (-),score=31.65 NODE_6549_length_872_cov_35.407210_g5954_i0:226-816(-)